MGRWVLRLLSLGLSFVVIGALVATWGWSEFTRPGPLSSETNVVIPAGAGVDDIARRLVRAGVASDSRILAIGAKLSGQARRLKAGEFSFPVAVSAREVLDILESGETVVRRLTVAEGLTSVQVVDILMAADGLTGQVADVPAEGSLLPETYHYHWGDGRDAIVTRMRRAMDDAVDALWNTRADGIPLETPEQAIVLASIIEKETGVAEERPLVASVFINRLRLGMRLQSDPTVAYGVAGPTGLDRPLTRADLRTDTPYNTYVISGLPPRPIANPGVASIAAALNPADSDYLYFVADGSGGHAFARTLDEHNRNVRAWRRIQRSRRE